MSVPPRTFIAENMAEAIDRIRRELGHDAVIVSSFTNDAGKLEVIATIEPASKRAGDLEATLEKSLRDRLNRAVPPSLLQSSAAQAHPPIKFDETLIADALEAQAAPQNLRDDLVAASLALGDDNALSALARALEARFSFAPIPAHPPAPVMLVGPPGSGKTVTVAKLAANALIENTPADLITTDTERAGAAAQAEAYAQLLGLHARPAENIDTLSRLLEENTARGNASCFVDTASINPFDPAEFASLKRWIETARIVADAEPVLVISAATDTVLLTEIVSNFAELGVRRLIATHVDISRRIGGILAAADISGFGLAQISVTPYLARGLGAMNSVVCARLILDTFETRRPPASGG